jgi:hypothetical protein
MSAQETRQEDVQPSLSTYGHRDQNRSAIATTGIGGAIMTTMEIGKELVALCKQGKNQEAIDRLYAPNIESVEPFAMPGMEQTRGIAEIKGKNQWWVNNHEVHGNVAEGPFPHGDRFLYRAIQV